MDVYKKTREALITPYKRSAVWGLKQKNMKSYLKFLSRNKLYTAVEAVGLVVSLAFVIIIGSYVAQHLAVVYQQPGHDRIYGLGTTSNLGLSVWDKSSIEAQVPGIEAIARFGYATDEISYHKKNYEAEVRQVDAEFFEIFPQFSLVEGTAIPFDGTHNAIVSRSFANSLEKKGDLIGQRFVIGGEEEEYIICGIMDGPENTLVAHIDVLIPVNEKWWAGREPFHSVDGTKTFIRRMENTNEEDFKAQILEVCRQNYGSWINKELKIFSFKEMFFRTENDYILRSGNLSSIRILSAVVFLLLLSALINYVNLNMALVGKRAKEMATRRLLGAQKLSVMGKLIIESVLFTAVCFGFAFLLAHTLVPVMNWLLTSSTPESDIQLQLMTKPTYIVAYLSGILLMGTLSGWLPALYASYYEPIDVVRGTFRHHSKMWLSKIFIIFQNVLSVILIAIAIVMEVQMWHMIKRPVHANTKDLFYISGIWYPVPHLATLADEIAQLPCVKEVGIGRGFPGSAAYSVGIRLDEEDFILKLLIGDSAYFRMLGFEVVEDFGHPLANSLWLGEHAFAKSGASDTSVTMPKKLAIMMNQDADYIGGMLKDFPGESAASPDGLSNQNVGVLVQETRKLAWASDLFVRTIGDHSEARKIILKQCQQWAEKDGEPFAGQDDCGYVDDLNLKSLEPAKRTVRLLEIFMGLSVLLSLLGLVAMSTYYCDEGSHSIAVRKVFGSDVNRELLRTVKSYMMLVGIAAIIGAPIAVWLSGKYLERFAYRIEHYGWVIVVAVVITLLLAFLSVLWQTLRAARTNPAEALKKE